MKPEPDANPVDAAVNTTQPDEFHGMGGSYILDVKTGKRRRVDAPAITLPAPATRSPAEPAPAEPAEPAAQGSPRPALRRVISTDRSGE